MSVDFVLELIRSLPEGLVTRLYGERSELSTTTTELANSNSVWACKAVFQSLTGLTKNVILRMLFTLAQFHANDISVWFIPEKATQATNAVIEEMKNLRIITETVNLTYVFNLAFRANILKSISNPERPWEAGQASLKPDKNPPSISLLDNFSNLKWENILRMLVGAPLSDDSAFADFSAKNVITASSSSSVSKDINEQAAQKIREMTNKCVSSFFVKCGLMTEIATGEAPHTSVAFSNHQIAGHIKLVGPNGKPLRITARGYEFMLKDRLTQVWSYVRYRINRESRKEEAVGLLFMLSFCELGHSYPVASLTESQRQLIFEFSFIGFIYLRNIRSSRFSPTRIAIHLLDRRSNVVPASLNKDDYLTSTKSNTQQTFFDSSYMREDFKVIVETNNQVIAYTTSDLDLALLGLFAHIQLRMPNMIVGKITRDKAKQAYKTGITANQIIEFLTSHAHPLLLQRQNTSESQSNEFTTTIVPQNVSDQLLLWEAENYRIKAQECILFSLSNVRGMSTAHFKSIIEQMRKLNCLLWADETTRYLAVTQAGAEQLKSFAEEKLGLYGY